MQVCLYVCVRVCVRVCACMHVSNLRATIYYSPGHTSTPCNHLLFPREGSNRMQVCLCVCACVHVRVHVCVRACVCATSMQPLAIP